MNKNNSMHMDDDIGISILCKVKHAEFISQYV